MNTEKPKLNIEGQIEHMESKGITFNNMSKDVAREYLTNHNNYFKLRSYRKNFSKHPGGKNVGKYVDLDFSYLIDLSYIDMELRYALLHMCLDVEHFSKVKLMKAFDKSDFKGFEIVKNYLDSLDEKNLESCNWEIEKNTNNPYCGDLISKYRDNLPIWVFIEIISFGRYIRFYKFCADSFENDSMKEDFYIFLHYIKDLRNATAHNNCILNNLSPKTTEHPIHRNVQAELRNINLGSSRRLTNIRLQQIICLLYLHKNLASDRNHKQKSKALHQLIERMHKNNYYTKTPIISGTFSYLKELIDNWYNITYT